MADADDLKSMRDKTRDSMPCEKCGALPGEACIGVRGGDRTSVHVERIVLWRKVAQERRWRRM